MDSNHQPSDYKSAAPPLRHIGMKDAGLCVSLVTDIFNMKARPRRQVVSLSLMLARSRIKAELAGFGPAKDVKPLGGFKPPGFNLSPKAP